MDGPTSIPQVFTPFFDKNGVDSTLARTKSVQRQGSFLSFRPVLVSAVCSPRSMAWLTLPWASSACV